MAQRLFDRQRKGNIVCLTAVLMVVLMGMLAFSLDLGYLYVTRAQLQRSADAAALAAAWELVDAESLSSAANYPYAECSARAKAVEFAALNDVLTLDPEVSQQDIQVGVLDNIFDRDAQFVFNSSAPPNAVSVRVRRDATLNGQVPLIFARVLGLDQTSIVTEAVAATITNIRGFQIPSDGGNLGFLPIALDEPTMGDLMIGIGTDDWSWDPETQQLSPGPDGVPEADLYPRDDGPPGNRGTVDVGSNNNSTADISRQITDGVTPEDLDHHGGQLEFDDNGELFLNGDTGISAGIKDELQSIMGEPRIVPVFRSVEGPGNNATYTIVAFIGIRIMEVKLTGPMSNKRVIIQPAKMVTLGAIPSTGEVTSYYVYSPAWLVR